MDRSKLNLRRSYRTYANLRMRGTLARFDMNESPTPHTALYRNFCKAVFCVLSGIFLYICSFPAALSFVARHPQYDHFFDSFYAPLPEWWKRRVIRSWMDDVDVETWRMWIRQEPLGYP